MGSTVMSQEEKTGANATDPFSLHPAFFSGNKEVENIPALRRGSDCELLEKHAKTAGKHGGLE